MSELDRTLNWLILCVFLFQLALCMTGATWYCLWEAANGDDLWYEHTSQNEASMHFTVAFFAKTGTWLLQLGNMVPISLIVTLNTVKFLQCRFISWDEKIWDQERDRPARAQTSQVLESLGQVTH